MTTPQTEPTLDADRARHLLETHRDSRHQQLLDLNRLPVEEREPADEAMLAATLQVLAEIDAALDRLAAGTYGTCTGCGNAVPPGRLEVLPYTATCVACTAAGVTG